MIVTSSKAVGVDVVIDVERLLLVTLSGLKLEQICNQSKF